QDHLRGRPRTRALRSHGRRGLPGEPGLSRGGPHRAHGERRMSLLEVENLRARYGAITALKGIDLRVEEGELVALVGSNGAGKTTTLAAIAGSHRASGGTIHLDGKPIHNKPSPEISRRGIALVPEDRGVFPSLTVDENLQLGSFFLTDNTIVSEQL